jgi:hypothetical protein
MHKLLQVLLICFLPFFYISKISRPTSHIAITKQKKKEEKTFPAPDTLKEPQVVSYEHASSRSMYS